MAAGEPGVLVDDRPQPLRGLVVGALPERVEGAGGGDDRVVVDAVAGADLGQAVGHAGAAGDAVDQALGAFEHALEDALAAAHLPEHVHVDAALAPAGLVGEAGLADAALDRVGDQLLVPLEAVAPAEHAGHVLAVRVEHVGVHAREGSDPAGRGPGPGRAAVADRDSLAPLDQGPDLGTRQDHGLNDAHLDDTPRSAGVPPGSAPGSGRLLPDLPDLVAAAPQSTRSRSRRRNSRGRRSPSSRRSPPPPPSRRGPPSPRGPPPPSRSPRGGRGCDGQLVAGLLVDGAHAELDLAAVVDGQDLDLHLVAFLDHVGDLADALVGELGDVARPSWLPRKLTKAPKSTIRATLPS